MQSLERSSGVINWAEACKGVDWRTHWSSTWHRAVLTSGQTNMSPTVSVTDASNACDNNVYSLLLLHVTACVAGIGLGLAHASRPVTWGVLHTERPWTET